MLGKVDPDVRPMRYPVLSGSNSALAEPESAADLLARIRKLEMKIEEREKLFANELETVRREGVKKGREQAHVEQVRWRKESAAQLAAALDEFRSHRDEYLVRVEEEVVRLSLAIAERVLRREAQMDPLLLAGPIRVALGQLAEATMVRLRVPAEQQEMWSEMLCLIPGGPLRAEVVPDQKLRPAELVLESEMGMVDLSVRAQLAEIERGFFDSPDARGITHDEFRAHSRESEAARP